MLTPVPIRWFYNGCNSSFLPELYRLITLIDTSTNPMSHRLNKFNKRAHVNLKPNRDLFERGKIYLTSHTNEVGMSRDPVLFSGNTYFRRRILCCTSEYLFVKLFRQRHVHKIKIFLFFIIVF